MIMQDGSLRSTVNNHVFFFNKFSLVLHVHTLILIFDGLTFPIPTSHCERSFGTRIGKRCTNDRKGVIRNWVSYNYMDYVGGDLMRDAKLWLLWMCFVLLCSFLDDRYCSAYLFAWAEINFNKLCGCVYRTMSPLSLCVFLIFLSYQVFGYNLHIKEGDELLEKKVEYILMLIIILFVVYIFITGLLCCTPGGIWLWCYLNIFIFMVLLLGARNDNILKKEIDTSL